MSSLCWSPVNTASAIALDQLKAELSVPVIGMIEPGVRSAIKNTRSNKVGVIGTEVTIQSGAYTRAIKAANAEVEVHSRAWPLFVSLVEEGWTDNEVVEMAATAYLGSLNRAV